MTEFKEIDSGKSRPDSNRIHYVSNHLVFGHTSDTEQYKKRKGPEPKKVQIYTLVYALTKYSASLHSRHLLQQNMGNPKR